MVSARELDNKMLILLKQGKGFFHMGCSGHEAAQIAAGLTFKKEEDWSYPYYRDGAYVLGLGLNSRQQLLSFLARADDPCSGGRQMPMHYSKEDLRIFKSFRMDLSKKFPSNDPIFCPFTVIINDSFFL